MVLKKIYERIEKIVTTYHTIEKWAQTFIYSQIYTHYPFTHIFHKYTYMSIFYIY